MLATQGSYVNVTNNTFSLNDGVCIQDQGSTIVAMYNDFTYVKNPSIIMETTSGSSIVSKYNNYNRGNIALGTWGGAISSDNDYFNLSNLTRQQYGSNISITNPLIQPNQLAVGPQSPPPPTVNTTEGTTNSITTAPTLASLTTNQYNNVPTTNNYNYSTSSLLDNKTGKDVESNR